MGMRDVHAFNATLPPKPTPLQREIEAAPTYPGAYGSVTEYVNTPLVAEAARKYFSYMLMIGADKEVLTQDPYWKYMEDDA